MLVHGHDQHGEDDDGEEAQQGPEDCQADGGRPTPCEVLGAGRQHAEEAGGVQEEVGVVGGGVAGAVGVLTPPAVVLRAARLVPDAVDQRVVTAGGVLAGAGAHIEGRVVRTVTPTSGTLEASRLLETVGVVPALLVLEELQTEISPILPLTEEARALEPRLVDTLRQEASRLLLLQPRHQAAGQAAVGRLGATTQHHLRHHQHRQ